MKTKIILCAAAALAFAVGAASAKTRTTTVSLDGFCDVFTITTDGGNAGLLSTDSTCDPGIGSGYIGKIKKHGLYAGIGAVLNGSANEHWLIGLQYPLHTGGGFTFGYTTDGTDIGNDLLLGTYTVNETAAKGPHGTKSATSMFKKH